MMDSGFEFSVSSVALVDTRITAQRPGRVWYEASCWPARLSVTDSDKSLFTPDQSAPAQVTIEPGEIVRVVGREGITLLVVPA